MRNILVLGFVSVGFLNGCGSYTPPDFAAEKDLYRTIMSEGEVINDFTNYYGNNVSTVKYQGDLYECLNAPARKKCDKL